MKLSPRAQALQIWKLIADGIFQTEPGDPPSFEYAASSAFVRYVALEVLEADKSKDSVRANEMLKAVGLHGKLNPNELALEKVLQSPDLIFSAEDEHGNVLEWKRGERMKLIIGLLREADPSLSELTDDELRKRIDRVMSTR